jgi:hypothetical protein
MQSQHLHGFFILQAHTKVHVFLEKREKTAPFRADDGSG